MLKTVCFGIWLIVSLVTANMWFSQEYHTSITDVLWAHIATSDNVFFFMVCFAYCGLMTAWCMVFVLGQLRR